MRNQACEWETLSDEAPRASKRKYQDLEQRSAAEHELLNHLRNLSEPDSLGLLTRLRGGCSINDLLVSARELSETSSAASSDRIAMAIRQPSLTNQRHSRTGLEIGVHQAGGEIHPFSRVTLPPIASIWYATHFTETGCTLLNSTLTLNSQATR
jgi:hypothetical protein